MNNRVVVTGMGVVSSIGIGIDPFWQNLIAGKSGIRKVTLFDTSRFKRHYAGEITRFRPDEFMPSGMAHYFGRASQFAIAATRLALKDAGIAVRDLKRNGVAVVIGVTIPEGNAIDSCSALLLQRQQKKVNRELLLNIFSPSISRDVGFFFGLEGVNSMIPNACAAGNYAIGYGYDVIRSGIASRAIVGGAEALSRIAFQGFHSMNAMAPKVCAPFDKNRKGMMLGEGAGILLLESYAQAVQRKAHIYAEVRGYGASCDARHMTIPDRAGVRKAMAKALKNAGISTAHVDYISAHGTGTIANDRNETAAITDLFAERAPHIPVSSIKSMLGHCMGAASAIEAIACCLAIERGMIPPTINYRTPDPDCALDYVPNTARHTPVTVTLNNGFAFGGNNCCVVFGKEGLRYS